MKCFVNYVFGYIEREGEHRISMPCINNHKWQIRSFTLSKLTL